MLCKNRGREGALPLSPLIYKGPGCGNVSGSCFGAVGCLLPSAAPLCPPPFSAAPCGRLSLRFDLQCKKSGRAQPLPLVPGPSPVFGVPQPCHGGARPCPCSGLTVLWLHKAGTRLTQVARVARVAQVAHPSSSRCHLHPPVAPSQQLPGSGSPHSSKPQALGDTGTPLPPRGEPEGRASAVPPCPGWRPSGARPAANGLSRSPANFSRRSPPPRTSVCSRQGLSAGSCTELLPGE